MNRIAAIIGTTRLLMVAKRAYTCRTCGWTEQLPPYPFECHCCGERMERA